MCYKILFAAFILAGLSANSQQLQTSSLYELQGMFHNPAMAGTQGNGMIGATYRSQWSGISGSPKTATAFGSFNLPKQAMGLGGYLYNDVTGPTSRTGVQLSIAKHIPVSESGRISLGIETRFQQYALNRSKLAETLGSDPVLGASDNRFKFDAGAGAAFVNDKVQFGVAVSQLVQSKLDFYSGNLSRSEQARLYRHYYFHGLYKWNVDGATRIIPNFLAIYLPNAPTEFQFGARVEHNESLWWGIGWRVKQSFSLSAGVHANKKLTIGYALDMYKTPLSIFEGGSLAHEVVMRYNFLK
jgi:type IX secretion system PorP/SprF family membrane protein